MEQAIRLYHDGQDNEAMDRFMDILVKGTPSEKALANEYISKITLRMSTGIKNVEEEKTDEGIHEISEEKTKSDKSEEEIAVKKTKMDEEDKEIDAASKKKLISQKISSKILEMRRALLVELDKIDGVKIFMGEEFPKAISLESDYFFAKGTVFKPNVGKVLSSVAGLIFTLGKASCLILPEGTFGGDVAKLMNIRRAVILNTYFIDRGISAGRINVRLTGTDVKLPKELHNLSGIIILFDYNKSPILKQVEDLHYRGPKISMGVYPTSISTIENSGALIEFSVFETPMGHPTWKYQILQVQSDNTMLLLDEISGSEAVYHQSYWNGRKQFFGEAYAPGKYMFSLTASDIDERENVIRRLLVIKGKPGEEKKLVQSGTQSKEKIQPKGISSKPGSSIIIKKGTQTTAMGKKTKNKLPSSRKGKKPATPKKDSAVAERGETPDIIKQQETSEPVKQVPKPTEFSSQVNYKIYFNKEDTTSVTPNSEKKMVQVAETMKLYPMAKLKLIGYAYSGEPDYQTTAEDRVNMVASLLVNRYSVSRDRIQVQTKISEKPITFVEIRMIGKE
jgi:outer membrane protein OmpA-like peptidoglycan-associated protein